MEQLLDPHTRYALQFWLKRQAHLPAGELYQAIVRNYLGPFLSRAAKMDDAGDWALPTAVLDNLAAQHRQLQAHNLECFQHIFRYFSALSEQGIPWMALKGLAQVAGLYHDAALRPMADVDILLHPEHEEQAAAIAGQFNLKEHPQPNSQRLLTFYLDNRIFHIEHHLMICQPLRYPLDRRALWLESQTVEWNGLTLRVPGPAHAFLHAVINLAHDRFDAPFLKYLELHWLYFRLAAPARAHLLELAEQAECFTVLKVALDCVHHWFNHIRPADLKALDLPFFHVEEFPPYRAGRLPLRDLLFSAWLIDNPRRRLTFSWDALLRRAQIRPRRLAITDSYRYPDDFI